MIADQRKGVVIQDKGEQHKPRKLKQRKNKPEFVSTMYSSTLVSELQQIKSAGY